MLSSLVAAALTTCLWAGEPAKQSRHDPSRPSPGQDAEQVYHALLQQLAPLKYKYVSDETVPIKLATDKLPCLSGIRLEELSENTTHSIPRKLAESNPIIRVISHSQKSKLLTKIDQKSNKTKDDILVLSEVLFDRDHRFALLKYELLCGSKCSSGATLAFERTADGWTANGRRPCAFMVNGIESYPAAQGDKVR